MQSFTLKTWHQLIVSACVIGISTTVVGFAFAASDLSDHATNPGRLLQCTLGHALNLDPTKDQAASDVRYEGRYAFSLFLAPTPARPAARLDTPLAVERVSPATRVVADPAGLRRRVPPGFSRVVDFWPDRVEMTQTIRGPLVHFIVINQIDARRGTAHLFMTTATDIAAMNLKTVYQGPCRFSLSGKGRLQR